MLFVGQRGGGLAGYVVNRSQVYSSSSSTSHALSKARSRLGRRNVGVVGASSRKMSSQMPNDKPRTKRVIICSNVY